MVTQEAAAAAHKLRVAEFLARRGPVDAGPDSAAMREHGAHLLARFDVLGDASTILTDEREPSETEHLQIIAALKVASKRAHEEYAKFCEE